MNQLMRKLADVPLKGLSKQEIDPLFLNVSKTLREHCEQQRKRYNVERPNFYDADLRRLFSNSAAFAGNKTAAAFKVAGWTGESQYAIDPVLESMITRCRELNLRLAIRKNQAKLDLTVLLTVQALHDLQSSRHRVAR